MTTNETSNSGIGGATNSAPQLSPVFSYPLKDGGNVYVYGVKTGFLNILFAVFDDTSSEWVWSYTAFRDHMRDSASLSALELVLLAKDNLRAVKCPDSENPFLTLLRDKSAMEELTRAILCAFGGEDA